MTIVIFDADGVLLDTVDYHFERCLQLAPQKFSREEFLAHHEKNFYDTSRRNIFEGVNWDEYDTLIEDTYPNLEIHPDILDMLKKVYQHDEYRMCVVSSGHEACIRENFQNHNILHYFDHILGKQTSYSKVEKLTMVLTMYGVTADDCLFITDTLADIVEANQVGISTIGVKNGYHCERVLSKGNPIEIISSCAELLKFI